MIHPSRLSALALIAVGAFVASATPAAAFEKADWLVRGRIINMQPGDRSGNFVTMPGTGLNLDADTSLEFDFSYFPLRHLGLETSTTVMSQGVEANGAGKGMGDVAEARSLSTSFMVQWHPLPRKAVRPYVGIGANCTTFFSEDASASMELAMGGATRVRLDDSFGLVGQVGMDIMFMPNWSVNMDAKYITSETVARFDSATIEENVRLETNPWVFSTGVGYRF